jgi:hypothetical protein
MSAEARMHRWIRLATVTAVIAAVCGATAYAKPELAPVRIEHDPPAPMRIGEEATTVLTVRALADVDQVVVNVAPFKGVVLLSEPREATFAGLKRGDTRQLTVRVRLTDERAGTLAVTYRTVQGKRIAGGATTVIYTNAGAAH